MGVSWRFSLSFIIDNRYMDERLLKKIKEGEDEAFESVLSQHKGMIISIIKRIDQFYASDYKIDLNDMYQEATIALYEACKSYNDQGGAKFSTYAYTIIYRRLLKFHQNYFKVYYNEGLSLDHERYDHQDIVPSEHYYDDPVQMFLLKETMRHAQKIYDELSEMEKYILDLHDKNYTYKEIALKTGLKEKRIDYLLRKAKMRYKSNLDF